ncbi:hypothetical protein Rhal01_02191 [Rubritalea halochordaticola]|uniref:Uncharacterized protein n=1 Tax=Rubritalea halochordaticola TaxID=714537 RepID=A0ABP9V203_9BACT
MQEAGVEVNDFKRPLCLWELVSILLLCIILWPRFGWLAVLPLLVEWWVGRRGGGLIAHVMLAIPLVVMTLSVVSYYVARNIGDTIGESADPQRLIVRLLYLFLLWWSVRALRFCFITNDRWSRRGFLILNSLAVAEIFYAGMGAISRWEGTFHFKWIGYFYALMSTLLAFSFLGVQVWWLESRMKKKTRTEAASAGLC